MQYPSSVALGWALACALTLGGCGRAPAPSPDEACADYGEPCTCDADRDGRYACEGEVARCVCGDDEPRVGSDASARHDAGRGGPDGAQEATNEDAGELADAEVAQADAASDGGVEEDAGPMPRIPPLPADCPLIATGTVSVLGEQVRLWVGEKQPNRRGPILFYFHGTDGTAAEALGALGVGHAEILGEGGVIAAFTSSTREGTNTGKNVWFTGDFALADQILACAIAQREVDPRRIYAAGCSAGGLQASAMAYERSSYLAAVMTSSGGTVFSYQLDDPRHVPAFIGAHGEQGRDQEIIDYARSTSRQALDLAQKGGLSVVCDHGGGRCGSPAAVKNAQWQFLKDHSFGAASARYAGGLPASFPAVCTLVSK